MRRLLRIALLAVIVSGGLGTTVARAECDDGCGQYACDVYCYENQAWCCFAEYEACSGGCSVCFFHTYDDPEC
jgi:hypothetical protein